MKVFGLTGGIGSGKSAVARRLRAQGLPVVDADELARTAVLPGSDGWAAIAKHFGTSILMPDGSLNRKRLGQLVFSNTGHRTALERIVHPIVQRLKDESFSELEQAGEGLVGYEVPLLFELGLESQYRPVVVVTAPLEQRRLRIESRDGLDEKQIEARIGSQIPLESKIRWADYVVSNTESLEELERRTDLLLEWLRLRAQLV